MTTFTKFAIGGGTGGMGLQLATKLAASPNTHVVILSRSPSSTPLPSNVEVKIVDYGSFESLVSALKGVEVVISTLNGMGLVTAQRPLIKAAKEAGAKLFLPSEYGLPSANVKEGLLAAKRAVHEFLREIELPFLLVYTGFWSNTGVRPFFGLDFENGKGTIIGKGETPITFTSSGDISSFIAHALTNFPTTTLTDNCILRLEGDSASFKDLVAIYEKTHPSAKPIELEYISIEETKEFLVKNPGVQGLEYYLRLKAELGEADVKEGGESSNGLWKEFKPVSLESVVATW